MLIYNLENRGDKIIFHFIYYMLAGLKDIFDGKVTTHNTMNGRRPCDIINWNNDNLKL